MNPSTYHIPPSSPFKPKWYYTKAELLRIPSIIDGITPEDELKQRQQAVAFLQDLGRNLNAHSRDNQNRVTNCVCVATIHFHRFFVIHSMKQFPTKDIAAACLFLAGKSEDCSRKLDAVVKNWLCLKYALSHPPEYNSKIYEDAADYIVLLESIVLQTIGFNLQVELPHPIILNAMQEIVKDNVAGQRSKTMMEIAYFFATDILYMTNWCIRYPMRTLACMCIHLTVTWAEFEIPSQPSQKPWYSSIDSTLTNELIKELEIEFSGIYKKADKVHVMAAKRLGTIVSERPERSAAAFQRPSEPVVKPKKIGLREYREREAAKKYELEEGEVL